MRLFGLIGYPLGHSFSKKYFTVKFEKEGLENCRYENFPIESIEELEDLLENQPELEGLNVTIPYKEMVLSFLDDSSPEVKEIRACNCIRISGGRLHGYNTDISGFEQSLYSCTKPERHKKALILGTGGSARAIRYVLNKSGIEYKNVSRKPGSGIFSYEQLTDEIIRSHTLIINTTPLGMFPRVIEAPPIPYQYIGKDHLLFDLIYNPEKTLFMKKGEKAGAQIQNGYDMLVFQAEENWKIWNP